MYKQAGYCAPRAALALSLNAHFAHYPLCLAFGYGCRSYRGWFPNESLPPLYLVVTQSIKRHFHEQSEKFSFTRQADLAMVVTISSFGMAGIRLSCCVDWLQDACFPEMFTKPWYQGIISRPLPPSEAAHSP